MSKGIQKSSFGRLPDGTEIDLYTLTNANGLTCKIINYGATIVEIQTPDRRGKFANIVLGYDRLEDYVNGKDYRGAIIGRVANRIAGASFTLDGKTYTLAANDGPNHLHGGNCGFDKRVWSAKPISTSVGVGLLLSYTSSDNEEGYPGTLTVSLACMLSDKNTFWYSCGAKTYQPTPVNLTYHPYWNLAAKGNILRHELTILAESYTPTDSQHIPTGKINSVEGTPFDFRHLTAIGSRFKPVSGLSVGYNTNYALPHGKAEIVLAAHVREPESGRTLEIRTSQPALQFYSGTFLNEPGTGFCLETQGYPDAVHHNHFPSVILEPGQHYFHATHFRFSAD